MPADKKKYNANCPFWLRPNDTFDGWVIKEDEVKSLEYMFMAAARGGTAGRIATGLNERQLPAPRGEMWHADSVLNQLNNIAVLGRRKKSSADGFTADWYPVVIREELFDLVHERLKSSQKVVRGADDVLNLFAGRLFCACGSSLRWSDASLFCEAKWNGSNCTFEPLKYSTLERPLLKAILDAAQIKRRTPVLANDSLGLEAQLVEQQRVMGTLMKALTAVSNANSVPTITASIERTQKLIDELQTQLKSGRPATALPRGETLSYEQFVASEDRFKNRMPEKTEGRSLIAPTYSDLRTRIRSEIHQVTQRIIIDPIVVDGVRHIRVEGTDLQLDSDIKV